MSVEGRAFLKLFRAEVAKALPSLSNVRAAWDTSAKWTEFMLGTSTTRSTGDFGVLGRVGKSLDYRIQSEYFRIDQIWYSSHPTKDSDWIIDAFVEHENNISKLSETIRKILQLGAGLKVLVTYPEGAPIDQITERVAEQIHDRYGTPADARIVLILGELDGQTPQWSGFEFDGLGRFVRI